MLSSLGLGLGFLRASAPTSASRAFSASAVAQKLKSHSGAKKRFRVTAGGLFKRGQAGKQHLNTGFSASRINRLAQTVYANKAQSKTLRRLLPGRA